MIGTPDRPLVVPYDCIKTPAPISAGPVKPTITPLQQTNNNPAPRFPEGTMWKVDGKGGYIQVKEGEPITSETYISNGGQLVSLKHPDDSIKVVPKTGLARFTRRIWDLLRAA